MRSGDFLAFSKARKICSTFKSTLLPKRLLSAGLLALVGVGAPLSFGYSEAAAQEKRVRVMVFGSTWENFFKGVAAEFEKETGIGIDPVIENTAVEGMTKLQAMKRRPEVDVWLTNGPVAARAMTDKSLFVPLPKDKIPNLANLVDLAKGNDMLAPFMMFPLGIVYRPDLVPGGKVTSWADLWTPGFRNRVTLPGPSVYPGKTMLLASLLNGGKPDEIDSGLKLLARVKDNIAMYYSADQQARRSLAQGEVWAMMTTPSAIKALRDQKVPVAMVSPKPTPMVVEGFMMVKAGREDLAAKFIDKTLSKEWQARMTAIYNMGPVNKEVTPAPEYAEAAPKPEDVVVFDDALINSKLGEWTERFNLTVGK
jgi:putative spermidine/putrescine transport system substrate-binding protein